MLAFCFGGGFGRLRRFSFATFGSNRLVHLTSPKDRS